MSHKKAEEYLGEKIPNLFYGSEGYIVQEEKKPAKWVPKNLFESGGVLVDTDEDELRYAAQKLKEISAQISKYNLSCRPSINKRHNMYTCQRHLDLCAKLLSKLIETK